MGKAFGSQILGFLLRARVIDLTPEDAIPGGSSGESTLHLL